MGELKRLTGFTLFVVLIGLGIGSAFVMGAVATTGGKVKLDMTYLGERWLEYWLMLAITAITPYGLYALDNVVYDRD